MYKCETTHTKNGLDTITICKHIMWSQYFLFISFIFIQTTFIKILFKIFFLFYKQLFNFYILEFIPNYKVIMCDLFLVMLFFKIFRRKKKGKKRQTYLLLFLLHFIFYVKYFSFPNDRARESHKLSRYRTE